MNHFVYVEDDPTCQEVMRLLLLRMIPGHRLTVIADTNNLPHQVAALNTPPDVIFLDLSIGPLDGYAALNQLRAAGLTVPVLAVTAADDSAPLVHEAGFDGLIFKPINQRTFPDKLLRLLEGEEVWDG